MSLFILRYIIYITLGLLSVGIYGTSIQTVDYTIRYFESINKITQSTAKLNLDDLLFSYKWIAQRLHGQLGAELICIGYQNSYIGVDLTLPFMLEAYNINPKYIGQWQFVRGLVGGNIYVHSPYMNQIGQLYSIPYTFSTFFIFSLGHERHLVIDNETFRSTFIKPSATIPKFLVNAFESLKLQSLTLFSLGRVILELEPGISLYRAVLSRDKYEYRKFGAFIELQISVIIYKQLSVFIGGYYESIWINTKNFSSWLNVNNRLKSIYFRTVELGISIKNIVFGSISIYISYSSSYGRSLDFPLLSKGIGGGAKMYW